MFLKNEIRFCLSILAVLFFVSTVNGQSKADVEVCSANYRHVAFVAEDTSFRFTRFIKQDGSFGFWQDFVDTTYADECCYFRILPNGVGVPYRYVYSFIPRVDTLNSYIPIGNVEYDKDSLINIRDELIFSYILKKAGEPIVMDSKQDVVRVVYPCDEINQCNSYILFKVVFNGDSATLHNVMLRSSGINGMEVISRDSCQLKRKDVESIRNLLCKSGSSSNTICRGNYNPWLVEAVYNGGYMYSIGSYDCLRHAKEELPMVGMPFVLMRIGVKRFGNGRF